VSGRTVLLVLKAGADYIRVHGGVYLPGGLQKASVFAEDQIGMVRGHRNALQRAGHAEACICRLTIEEEVLACD
jgi:hypothetical protein